MLAVCRQVVAGTNYRIVFSADLPCTRRAGDVQQQTLDATVFVPLPFTNAQPQVTSVQRVA